MYITFDILSSAHPYLDPGSGSFILQLLLATLLGAGAMIGIYWKKVKAFFSRAKDRKEEEESGQD